MMNDETRLSTELGCWAAILCAPFIIISAPVWMFFIILYWGLGKYLESVHGLNYDKLERATPQHGDSVFTRRWREITEHDARVEKELFRQRTVLTKK